MGKNYKGIDGRSINCACGHPNCIAGLSFETLTFDKLGVIRFHYPETIETTKSEKLIHQAEYPMKVNVVTIDAIIDILKSMKKELIKLK